MSDLEFFTIFEPTPEQIETIDKGLHEYNLSHLGEAVIYNYHRLAAIARDENDAFIGGIWRELIWEWLYIQSLWVEEKHRGNGIGTKLLVAIEQAAVSKGFNRSHLETTNFQALDFYLRNGYEVFGKLEGKPAGSTWYYIKKELSRLD